MILDTIDWLLELEKNFKDEIIKTSLNLLHINISTPLSICLKENKYPNIYKESTMIKDFKEWLNEIKSVDNIEYEYRAFTLKHPEAKPVLPAGIKVGDSYMYKGVQYIFNNSWPDLMRMTIDTNVKLVTQ